MAKPRKNYGAPAEKVVSIQSAPKSAGTFKRANHVGDIERFTEY